MSINIALDQKTYYFPIEVLNALNAAPLIGGTQELPFRGQIKSIRTKFLMPDVSSLNATMLYYPIFVDAKVELLDGSLTTFDACMNANYVQFTEIGNTIQFNFTASENTALEFIDQYNYFKLFTTTPTQFILMLEGSFNPNGDTMIRVDNTIGNTITLSQTPVIWSNNNNGGGNSGGDLIDFININGKIVANVTVDPTVTAVTYNGGSALPVGSVIKNSVTNQKFLKISGDMKAFHAIPVTAKSEWSWSSEGIDDWDTLQSY